jgi:hypothetical protein
MPLPKTGVISEIKRDGFEVWMRRETIKALEEIAARKGAGDKFLT